MHKISYLRIFQRIDLMKNRQMPVRATVLLHLLQESDGWWSLQLNDVSQDDELHRFDAAVGMF